MQGARASEMRESPEIRLSVNLPYGTVLAPGVVVPTTASSPACHWSYVQGPIRGGRVVRTMVWICEHPFRTIRLGGPCEDCECTSSANGPRAEGSSGPASNFPDPTDPQVA